MKHLGLGVPMALRALEWFNQNAKRVEALKLKHSRLEALSVGTWPLVSLEDAIGIVPFVSHGLCDVMFRSSG